MQLYLDVSCLNRPFDDQRQARIRLESETILFILQRIDTGVWSQVSSEIALLEINAIRESERRDRVLMLLPAKTNILNLTPAMFARAAALDTLGFKPADALHVAAAEVAHADVLLTCDDRLCRLGKRHRRKLRVAVANPVDWLKEQGYGSDT
jgi:predicted nucleic acid-binding protein